MDAARQKVEYVKKHATQQEMARVRFSMKLPDGYENFDYHKKIAAERMALDNSIAEHLGVELSDRDTWPDEQGKILANEWAATLPDK